MAVIRNDVDETFDDEGNVVASEPVQRDVTAETNEAELTDPSTLSQRMADMDAFKDDPDIVALLARPNNQAPTTQEINREHKAIVRQMRRLLNQSNVHTRLIDPVLLDDISNTTGE